MSILIKNGYILDPASRIEGVRDILIEDGIIREVAVGIQAEAEQVIDAAGCHVMPGLIDLHVHLREPGFEYKETVATGSRAGAAGGYTTVCAMPNTKPSTDRAERVSQLMEIIKKDAVIKVLPIGAVTLDQAGTELSDAKAMKDAGICALSEDGKSVMDIALYREGIAKAKEAGIPVFAHCEDRELLNGGVVNAKGAAKRLGMPGITNNVEDHITIRDILLAMELDAQLHLCHCSTELSVDLIKLAKRKGAKVSAEVCPHHFSMTEDEILTDDANYKMNPPLRSQSDVDALIAGLKDGTIEVIATDHAPHGEEEKKQSMRTAPFGIVGSETAYALSLTNLVKTGDLTYMQLVEKMSYNPAKVLGLDKLDGRGTLRVGAVADIAIADPDEKWIIDPEQFQSKGKNTPFGGTFVYGKVKMTIVDGNVVYQQK